ncbi:MAG: hypothetical protein WKF43_04580 [Acidimicrobiales bacterium]
MPSNTADPVLIFGGGSEVFRPDELRRGQVWTGGRLVSRAQYRALDCTDPSTTTTTR